jgi:sodium/potassium-transporting ATPase subunit alpha
LPLALRAYLFLGAIEAAITMAAFFFVLDGGGWRYGHALAMSDPLYLRATTACFSAIVVLQIVNVFLCRSATRSILSTGILGNPLIWGGVIVEIALVVLIGYTPLGNSIFATAPINAQAVAFHPALRRRDAGRRRSAEMDRACMLGVINSCCALPLRVAGDGLD